MKIAVTTLKVTAPAARDGFSLHWSHASSALPVSFIAVRESRSQDGRYLPGIAMYAEPTPGMMAMDTPVASFASPVHACFVASQPSKPTSVPRPLMVPHTPSTMTPLPKS